MPPDGVPDTSVRLGVALVPFAGPLALMLIVAALAAQVGMIHPDANTPQWAVRTFGDGVSLDSLVRESRARVTWALAMAVFAFATLATAIGSLLVMREAIRREPYRGRTQAAVSIVTATGVVALTSLAAYGITGFRFGADLSGVLFGPVSNGSYAAIADVLITMNIASACCIFLLACAMAACLSPPAELTAHYRQRLRWQMSRLRVLLYLGAMLLVSGTLEVAALCYWPAALAVDAATSAALLRLAGVYTLAAGTVLSLLLVASYGPAALLLRVRADRLAESETGSEDSDQQRRWLRRHGLHSTLAQHALRTLTAIAPLVAGGPLSVLLTAAAGG